MGQRAELREVLHFWHLGQWQSLGARKEAQVLNGLPCRTESCWWSIFNAKSVPGVLVSLLFAPKL